ncbi:hypothetical protein IMZ48_30695 [Candidatus Bathyarchaeota archaeon]|nr:hypothetical protein [Candidatus Bathyarchaeota archaeon]
MGSNTPRTPQFRPRRRRNDAPSTPAAITSPGHHDRQITNPKQHQVSQVRAIRSTAYRRFISSGTAPFRLATPPSLSDIFDLARFACHHDAPIPDTDKGTEPFPEYETIFAIPTSDRDNLTSARRELPPAPRTQGPTAIPGLACSAAPLPSVAPTDRPRIHMRHQHRL